METEQNINYINKKYDLTEEEMIKAKENCFILLGKTGTGKTTLLNLIYGDNIGKVGYETKSETKLSSYYCIKEEINSKKICFSIIDTPCLYDTDDLQNDEKIKNNTKELIAKENLKIKGILFLSNFQNERFDYSEIDSLFQYNTFFPLKNFWKHVILIFTHYYGDPDGYSKEEIKDNSIKNLTLLFSELMERIKEVSTPVNFIDIERLYVNIHSKIKNENHLKDNEIYKKQILEKICNFIQLEPMYNKFCIFKFNNIEIKKYKGYLFDSELEIFLDKDNKILNKKFKMIKIQMSNENIGDKNQVEINMVDCEVDNSGNLSHKNIIKKGSLSDFKLSFAGGGLILLSFVGGVFVPFIGLYGLFGIFGGFGMIYQNVNTVENKNKIMEQKKERIINELNIEHLICDEIINYMKNHNMK